MDFAYQRPKHNSSHGTSRSDLSTGQEEEQTPNATDSFPQKAFKRPSPPPIDTFQNRNSRSDDLEHNNNSEQADSLQNQDANDESNRSFYWQSPSSNSDSPKPFEDDHPINPAKTATEGLTSATALGFGGPSDWEHFGDYDAEEVDDIDLYTSSKPKTAELPAASTPVEGHEAEGQDTENNSTLLGANGRDLGAPRGPVLSTIEERGSENNDDELSHQRDANGGQPKSINASGVVHAHPPPFPPLQKTMLSGELRDSQDRPQEENTEPPVLPEEIVVQSGSQAGSLDINSVNSDRPSSQETATPSQESQPLEDETNHEERQESLPGRQDPDAEADKSQLGNKISIEQIAIAVEPSNDRVQPDTSQQRDSLHNDHHESKDSLDKASQLTSPTSDDGKEDIIISLQVPGTPPPSNVPTPLNVSDIQPRYIPESLTADAGQRSPDLLRTGRKSIFPQSIELEDPYAGLDSWAKASLNRYIKMLREEAQASSDEDKYMVFVNFTEKETRNRATLYDMDDESDLSDLPISRVASKRKAAKQLQAQSQQGQTAAQPHDQPQTQSAIQPQASHQSLSQTQPHAPHAMQIQVQPQTGRRGNLKSKALPALPPPEQPKGVPQILQSGPIDEKKNTLSSGNNFAANHNPSKGKAVAQNGKSDESFVMIDSPQSEPSQPPERPKDLKEKSSGMLKGPSLGAFRKALDIVAAKKGVGSSHSADSQPAKSSNIESAEAANTQTPPTSQPESGQGTSTPTSADKSQYKAFSYINNEGKPYEGDKAANRQSLYSPFSTMLRQTSIRSGRSDGETIRSFSRDDNTSSISSEHQLSKVVDDNVKSQKKQNYRYTILEPLLGVVPQESVLREEPEALTRLRLGMDAVPDDFSFIHQTVLAWDAEAKKSRELNEQERHVRQGQNEQRIDELFNGHEIGYSDIHRLEEDYKRSEASKKAEEDREEVQTFVASVFDVVWARINYEMDQLTPLYDDCTRLVASSSAGREMFEDTTGRVPIAPAMEILLILYHKLHVRHQKAFEAVLERDRRLKKTEIDPWYALGAIEQYKRIKERYEDAEKRAILEFCRQRDERANLLMDVLDQNTLRGVGANQDYMESVMQATRRISLDVALGGVGEDDVVATDGVLKAKTITTALARSSEQIVQTFHVADMLLNAADYEVSVANAKLSNADANAFKKLREAKAKEDSKLAMDLEHRMGLIRRDTARTQDEVAKLLMLIQKSIESIDSESSSEDRQSELVESEKEERLKKALKEAKRRKQERG